MGAAFGFVGVAVRGVFGPFVLGVTGAEVFLNFEVGVGPEGFEVLG